MLGLGRGLGWGFRGLVDGLPDGLREEIWYCIGLDMDGVWIRMVCMDGMCERFQDERGIRSLGHARVYFFSWAGIYGICMSMLADNVCT